MTGLFDFIFGVPENEKCSNCDGKGRVTVCAGDRNHDYDSFSEYDTTPLTNPNTGGSITEVCNSCNGSGRK